VFVGGGGTMTAESALLGVPTFSCYPGDPYIISKYLIKNKLITLERNPVKLAEKIWFILDNLNTAKKTQTERIQRLVGNFEDPIKVIVTEIEKLG
jgi:predicted glycosyltransferase